MTRGTAAAGSAHSAAALTRPVQRLYGFGHPSRVPTGITGGGLDRRWGELGWSVGQQLAGVVGHRFVGVDQRVGVGVRVGHDGSKPAAAAARGADHGQSPTWSQLRTQAGLDRHGMAFVLRDLNKAGAVHFTTAPGSLRPTADTES